MRFVVENKITNYIKEIGSLELTISYIINSIYNVLSKDIYVHNLKDLIEKFLVKKNMKIQNYVLESEYIPGDCSKYYIYELQRSSISDSRNKDENQGVSKILIGTIIVRPELEFVLESDSSTEDYIDEYQVVYDSDDLDDYQEYQISNFRNEDDFQEYYISDPNNNEGYYEYF